MHKFHLEDSTNVMNEIMLIICASASLSSAVTLLIQNAMHCS